MFSNSQLHALIFLAGMLSTHFLVIGKFWKMKWNSMFEEKLGFALISPCWFYPFCLNCPHSCHWLLVICLDFYLQASVCTGLSSVSLGLTPQDMMVHLLFSCSTNSVLPTIWIPKTMESQLLQQWRNLTRPKMMSNKSVHPAMDQTRRITKSERRRC